LLALLAYLGLTSSIPYLNLLDDTLLFYGQRLRGFFKDPNVFGPYLVVVVAYALCSLQTRQGSYIKKILWAACCIICTLGVLLCFSRAAWANYVVTVVVLLVLNAMAGTGRVGPRRQVVYFLLGGVVAAAAAGYALTTARVNELAVDRSEMQSYDEDRFTKHAEALQLGLRNPLGVGPGQSQLLLGYNPHSLPLGIFAENGIIGLLSLAGFVLVTLIRSLALSQKAANGFQRSMFALVAAAIIGTLLNSLVIDPTHWRHLWLLLALGWMPVWASASARRRRLPCHSEHSPPRLHMQIASACAFQFLSHTNLKQP
jgi:O-antigen ligase